MKKLRTRLVFFAYLLFLTIKVSGLRADSYLFEDNKERFPEIHVFIHVCTLGHWHEVLERQLSRIKASGLYDACHTISLGVLGNGDISSIVIQFPKLDILFQDSRIGLYERPTLYRLHSLCMNKPDALVLYLHTKGIGHPGSQSVADWSNYMEYFSIDCWRDCVRALTEEHHDICGVNWKTDPYPHFSGNFWWASARYVSSLPNRIGDRYLDPEMWLGQNSPNFRCFHYSGISHYGNRYPESMYKW